MPKQLAHSSRAMYLSWSASHASKKLVVQCSMGMRGARRGASSVWDRKLKHIIHTFVMKMVFFLEGERRVFWEYCTCKISKHLFCWQTDTKTCENIPIRGVLVELAELPVHREDIHVVVLLKVQDQQIQRVVTSLQTLLVLKDLLYLETKHTFLKT